MGRLGLSKIKIRKLLAGKFKIMQKVLDKNYYATLGVAREADEKTIKKAFRQAALQAHPDKGGTDAEFQMVNEAWSVLGDASKRAAYDRVSTSNDTIKTDYF